MLVAVPWYAGLPNMDADYARYMATEWGRSARRAVSHLPLLLGCTIYRALVEYTVTMWFNVNLSNISCM